MTDSALPYPIGWFAFGFSNELQPGDIHPALTMLPPKLLTRLVLSFLFRSFIHDTRQDFIIWQHKKYVHPPALAEGDGPIGKYRQWARQFYVTDNGTG